MNPEGDLLGHGAADKESCRRLAEKLGELRLEFLDNPTLAVSVGGDVGGQFRQQVGRGPIAMPAHPAGAGLLDPIDLHIIEVHRATVFPGPEKRARIVDQPGPSPSSSSSLARICCSPSLTLYCTYSEEAPFLGGFGGISCRLEHPCPIAGRLLRAGLLSDDSVRLTELVQDQLSRIGAGFRLHIRQRVLLFAEDHLEVLRQLHHKSLLLRSALWLSSWRPWPPWTSRLARRDQPWRLPCRQPAAPGRAWPTRPR